MEPAPAEDDRLLVLDLTRLKRYRGTPMPAHCALPGLTDSMFEHWLDLFSETARMQPNREMAARAVELSERIAQSLWYGYQLHRKPDRMPASLSMRTLKPMRHALQNSHKQATG